VTGNKEKHLNFDSYSSFFFHLWSFFSKNDIF
jgi:hypothetical protein